VPEKAPEQKGANWGGSRSFPKAGGALKFNLNAHKRFHSSVQAPTSIDRMRRRSPIFKAKVFPKRFPNDRPFLNWFTSQKVSLHGKPFWTKHEI
jgi:hypothetical protein